MINRVLIRTKVVQMLYSYLLTKSEFNIDSAPESATKDRRYAYGVYLDMLLLIIELSGISAKPTTCTLPLNVDKKLAKNIIGKLLNANVDLREIILKGNTDIASFDKILQKLSDKITASKIYADYSKRTKKTLAIDVEFWVVVLETIIARDEDIEATLRSLGNYSTNGFELGIRQAVNTLRSYADYRQMLAKSKKDLADSLDKAYELYLWMFQLIVDITTEQNRRIDNAKAKYLVSSDDLNPNMKLADNALVPYLLGNEDLADLLDDYHIVKAEETSLLVKTLLDNILQSDLYKQYVADPVSDFASDVEFWRNVMRTIILPSDALAEELEDKSVYWNDDLQIMGTFVLKTLKQMAQSDGKPIDMLPKYKDWEDEEFGPRLFELVIENQETYRGYIDKFVNNSSWDPDRLAYMDIVILYTAIAELINFPNIPVPVTINEYIEIANVYSTEKSGAFINGLLFNLINYLKDEGIINK